ncbi:MAG: hypothetical protein RRA15_06505 [bacterium]|nr:hypothetical protein [bacterium]MDT8366125.1 hypothetical protein [bacterium]
MKNKCKAGRGMTMCLVCAMVLGVADMATALDFQLLGRSRLTVSDNIDRAPVGQEIEGYLLTMEGDLNISGEPGTGTVNFLAGGGVETRKSDDFSNSDNYRFRLNMRFPWATTGYVEGSANFSEETENPELGDINQGRLRTRRSNVSVGAGRRSSQTFQWHGNVDARTQRNIDLDLEETRGGLGWGLTLNRRRSLTIDVGYHEGSDAVEADSWTGSSLSFNMTNQTDRSTSTGYRLDWESSQLERSDGAREHSNMVSVVALYVVEMSTDWTFTSEVGVDGIKPIVDERRWEPRVELGVTGLPDRRVQFDSSLSVFSSIRDPEEGDVAWTRAGQIQAGLMWNLTSAYSVEPRIQYRYAEVYGNAAADRTDITWFFELAMSWSPSRTLSLEAAAVSETIDSTEAFRDLSENRLDLTLSAAFF